MEKPRLRKIVLSLSFCTLAIVLAARTSGFETIRAVQFLLIFAAGLNAGVALATLQPFRRT
jgi:hypothetical protein